MSRRRIYNARCHKVITHDIKWVGYYTVRVDIESVLSVLITMIMGGSGVSEGA